MALATSSLACASPLPILRLIIGWRSPERRRAATVPKGGLPAGAGSHGRVYELSQQTSGGSDLTSDHGFNFGLDARISLLDIWAGFTHSVHFDLNVVSFGVGVNIRNLLHRAKGA